MNDIIIIDDIVSPTYQRHLNDMTREYSFDWHFGPSNIYENKTKYPEIFMDENTIDSFQHTHLFYHDITDGVDKHFNFVRPLIYAIQDAFNLTGAELQRAKANMLVNNRNFIAGKYNPAHVDGSFSHMVVVYYCNDTDGDTVIFNETWGSDFTKLTEKQRITPKQGRAVCFPGKYFHASSNPIDNDTRTVFNLDFKTLGKMIL
jgi:hypothetical protein